MQAKFALALALVVVFAISGNCDTCEVCGNPSCHTAETHDIKLSIVDTTDSKSSSSHRRSTDCEICQICEAHKCHHKKTGRAAKTEDCCHHCTSTGQHSSRRVSPRFHKLHEGLDCNCKMKKRAHLD